MTSDTRDALRDKHQKGVMGGLLQPALSDPYYSPRPASRVGVSEKASEYLERNRGSLCLFLDKKNESPSGHGLSLDDVDSNQNYYSARGARVVGSAGRQIAKNNYGTMGGIIRHDDNRGYQTARIQPRLTTDDAKTNAAKATGQGMKLISHEANKGYESARPASRADWNAERTRSLMDGVMDHSQKYLDPLPAPRVRPEASGIAKASQGMCHQVLAGQVPGDPVCDVRVKYEGKNIYDKSQGTYVQLQSNYGKHPVSSRPEQRVKGPGAEIATQGRGSVHHLFHQYGKLPKSARPRLRPEARKYARRHEGSMASFLKMRRI